ncbi:geranylgeranyl reductase family protein [Belliella kenyensis]|uniref:Geranylgeranyl reductase family protein n=1 Tax=Belliella kenyensis TaxID=1472724 RepID=A0ABV8EF71_9BACT|nr:geranylgeranyl reductase family protein [Belliella kenyensis]MCH7401759.1 geranylgeranyl reductase family protein [Belliella kenyensis]MDN3604258.1 geranylgeranyl reductase family protein [Belliella kenyensis]
MKNFDVVIVGSGPAGGMAALEAAKGGLSVAILEKETLPRYKTCGGGLVFRGKDMLPFDIGHVVESAFNELYIYFDHLENPLVAKRDYPIVTMVMRDSFDELIVKEASKSGAVLLENHQLKSIDFQENIQLITSQGSISCKYLIAADGVMGPTAKLAGWKETRKTIPALEYEIEVDTESFESLSKEARFDIDAIPKGYGWCFPKKNHLSVGVGTFEKRKVNLRDHYQQYVKKLGIKHVISEQAHGFQVPVSPRTDGFVRQNVFLTGDAAGFADPLTAEGITNALYSGSLAGKAIAQHFDSPTLAEQSYLDALSVRLLPELKFTGYLAQLFYHQKTLRNLLMRQNGQRYCEKITDVYTGHLELSKDVKSRILKNLGLGVFA